MEGKMIWESTITPSMCDASGRLGIPNAFDLFMDMASMDSDRIGNGVKQLLVQGRFWVTTKTIIRFHKRPGIMDRVELSTWPENIRGTGGLKGNRDYMVRSLDGVVLLDGKSEWTMLDKNTNSYVELRDVYPPEYEFCEELCCPQKYFKLGGEFEGNHCGSHKVLGNDVDFVGHMNNVAYIKAFASCFSAKEWAALNISELEIHFRRPCFEGDVLDFYTRERKDGYTEVSACVGDAQKTVLRYK